MAEQRPQESRWRWWLVAAVCVAALAVAVALIPALRLNQNGDGAAPALQNPESPLDPTKAASTASTVGSAAPTASVSTATTGSTATIGAAAPGSTIVSSTQLSGTFGEPDHPVSGVEPRTTRPANYSEPGPPANVCRGTLPAQRVQLPLRFASTKPAGVDYLSWSPDCRRMVFRVGSTLWAADGDGTGDAPFLTAQHGLSAPAWSPDGEWIAFAQAALVEGERASHIYIVKPDALGLAQVTSGAVLDQQPAWSPDGAHIAFSRRTRLADSAVTPVLDQHLVIVEVATGAEQVLAAGGEHEAWPTWSPDGEVLAHRSGDALVLLRLDDLSPTRLFETVAGRGGTWSPEGTRVASFTTWNDAQAAIAIGWPQQLTASEVSVALSDVADSGASASAPTLRWSESGERLLFHHVDSQGGHWAYHVNVPQPSG